MPTEIARDYFFESAHYLPKVPDGHKCKNLHGHHYRMQVVIVGSIDGVGFLIDFWDLDKIVEPFHKMVDHHLLNEIPGLENPTAELIAHWFFGKLNSPICQHRDLYLKKITVWETPDCSATAWWKE